MFYFLGFYIFQVSGMMYITFKFGKKKLKKFTLVRQWIKFE